MSGRLSASHIARRTLREADFPCRTKDGDARMATRIDAKPGSFWIISSAIRAEHCGLAVLAVQLLKQLLGFFQIRQLETLGEPVIDVAEYGARLVTMSPFCEQARKAGRRAQFE